MTQKKTLEKSQFTTFKIKQQSLVLFTFVCCTACEKKTCRRARRSMKQSHIILLHLFTLLHVVIILFSHQSNDINVLVAHSLSCPELS